MELSIQNLDHWLPVNTGLPGYRSRVDFFRTSFANAKSVYTTGKAANKLVQLSGKNLKVSRSSLAAVVLAVATA